MKELTREIHYQAKLNSEGPIEYCYKAHALVYGADLSLSNFTSLLGIWLKLTKSGVGLIAGADTIQRFYDKKFA